jgi:membrane protease YdiL (CAAX protease family)
VQEGQKLQETKKRGIAGLVAAILLTAALMMFAPSWYGLFASVPLRIASILSVQIATAAIAIACHCAIEKQPLRSLGLLGKKLPLQLGWAFALFAGLLVLFVALPVLFGQALKDMLPAKDALWFAIPYKLLFVGFAEEMLFRGYFLNSFMRLANSKIAAVALSSLLFGLSHFILSGNFLQVAVTAVIGAILALPRMYAKNCSIVSVSLAHGLYDTSLSILSWVI